MRLKAAILSALIPGLGQILLGETVSGLSLIFACLGMAFVLSIDTSWLTFIFMIAAYLSLLFQAAKDAYHGSKNTESIQYILGLAVVIGPFSLPLLWQNQKIHPRVKRIWTLIILALTILLVLSMHYLDPIAEKLLSKHISIRF